MQMFYALHKHTLDRDEVFGKVSMRWPGDRLLVVALGTG